VTIILFLLIFSIVVLSHEFGHFILAKKNGVHVIEFSIGMGPMLLHIDHGETRYAIRLLPFGGACMFEGMDELEEKQENTGAAKDEQALAAAPREKDVQDGSFLHAGIWTRIAIIFAGPFFNLLLGFVIALILVGFSGSDLPVVQKVMTGSAAQEAGIKAGDTIKKVNGESTHLYREVSLASALNTKGTAMSIVLERNGKQTTVVLTPKYSTADKRYYLGLSGGGKYIKCTGLGIFQYGYYETEYVFRATIKSLQMLVMGQLNKNDVSGPIGIAHYVGQTYNEVKDYGLPTIVLTMMNFVLILSVNLGIMNLLPLPALDGGRLVFLLVELIRGKPVPPEKEGLVHFAGFILFFLLMIFIMYNDIMNYIIK